MGYEQVVHPCSVLELTGKEPNPKLRVAACSTSRIFLH